MISDVFLLALAGALAIGWYADHWRLSKQVRAEAVDPLCQPMRFSLRSLLIMVAVAPPIIAFVTWYGWQQYEGYRTFRAVQDAIESMR
jgi:hypothetical protein